MIRSLFLLCSSLFCIHSHATHGIAGYITYKWISGYTYEVTIHTYTLDNAADRDSMSIDLGDNTSPLSVARNNGALLPNGVGQGELLGINNIKYSEYSTFHNYPRSGFYTISVLAQNRVGSVVNFGNGQSANVPFYVETEISVQDTTTNTPNNSVQFFNAPLFIITRNDTSSYDIAMFDSDGDSLVAELVTPLRGEGLQVPSYILPDQISPGPSNVFTLNSTSGTVEWSVPQEQGVYTVAVKVSEYRKGCYVGSVILDYQVTVAAPINSKGQLLSSAITTSLSANIGDTITIQERLLKIPPFSLNGVNRFELEVNSPLLDQPSASYVVVTLGDTIVGTFQLVVNADLSRNNAYPITFRALTNVGSAGLSNTTQEDRSYRLLINGGAPLPSEPCLQKVTAIKETAIVGNAIAMYPNPVVGETIYFKGLPDGTFTVEMYNVSGKRLLINVLVQNRGVNISKLSRGLYHYSIYDAERVVSSGSFIR